jgi:hypothetical protein
MTATGSLLLYFGDNSGDLRSRYRFDSVNILAFFC